MQSPTTTRERLLSALKMAKMSQSRLAVRSTIARSVLTAYLKAERPMSDRHAVLISEVLGNTPSYWQGEQEKPKAQEKYQSWAVHPVTGRLIESGI